MVILTDAVGQKLSQTGYIPRLSYNLAWRITNRLQGRSQDDFNNHLKRLCEGAPNKHVNWGKRMFNDSRVDYLNLSSNDELSYFSKIEFFCAAIYAECLHSNPFGVRQDMGGRTVDSDALEALVRDVDFCETYGSLIKSGGITGVKQLYTLADEFFRESSGRIFNANASILIRDDKFVDRNKGEPVLEIVDGACCAYAVASKPQRFFRLLKWSERIKRKRKK